MTARARLIAVLAILAGGALALITSTQTWVAVELAAAGHPTLEASGAVADTLLAPLSLAALALALALAIVGRVLRYAFGVIAVLIGAGVAAGAARIWSAVPIEAYAAVVTESTGLRGDEAVAALVAAATATIWPLIAAIAGGLVAAGGIVTLATAHRWPGAGRRYRTDTAAAEAAASGSRPHDAIDSWDDLSRGDDPTDR